MDDTKGQSIFLMIVGIATLLVAVVGATFAWFSIGSTTEENPSEMVMTTARLGKVVFKDGDEINVTNLIPGKSFKKIFSVSQTDIEATEKIKYVIKLNIKTNTLTNVAENQFVHSLKSTGNTNSGTIISFENQVVPEETIILGTGELNGYETHTYEYTISFNESGLNQNAAQGKTFQGQLSVDLLPITAETK